MPVTRRLTPGSNDYTNPNTNPAKPSRHVTWTGGDHWGKLGGNYQGGITKGVEFTCFTLADLRNQSILCVIY